MYICAKSWTLRMVLHPLILQLYWQTWCIIVFWVLHANMRCLSWLSFIYPSSWVFITYGLAIPSRAMPQVAWWWWVRTVVTQQSSFLNFANGDQTFFWLAATIIIVVEDSTTTAIPIIMEGLFETKNHSQNNNNKHWTNSSRYRSMPTSMSARMSVCSCFGTSPLLH